MMSRVVMIASLVFCYQISFSAEQAEKKREEYVQVPADQLESLFGHDIYYRTFGGDYFSGTCGGPVTGTKSCIVYIEGDVPGKRDRGRAISADKIYRKKTSKDELQKK